jgi:hypothetical protein
MRHLTFSFLSGAGPKVADGAVVAVVATAAIASVGVFAATNPLFAQPKPIAKHERWVTSLTFTADRGSSQLAVKACSTGPAIEGSGT